MGAFAFMEHRKSIKRRFFVGGGGGHFNKGTSKQKQFSKRQNNSILNNFISVMALEVKRQSFSVCTFFYPTKLPQIPESAGLP